MSFAISLLLSTNSFKLEPKSKETQKWIHYFERERAQQTAASLANARPFILTFRKLFRREGVPEDLIWLAFVESSFRLSPTSPSGAQGMFQFKRATALEFKLEITPDLDERNAPLKAAQAAARYLNYLQRKFKDWDLTLAAYNLGEGDLRRLMRAKKLKRWRTIKPHVRKQTQDYVGKIKAAAILGNRFAQTLTKKELKAPLAYKVRQGDTLYRISRIFSTRVRTLKRENHLKSNRIQPNQILLIRIH